MIFFQPYNYLIDENVTFEAKVKEMSSQYSNTLQISSNLEAIGAIIQIEIFKSNDDFLGYYRDKTANIKFHSVPAMIDTGAHITVIDSSFIENLGLSKSERIYKAKGFGGIVDKHSHKCILYNSICKNTGIPLDVFDNEFSHEPYKAILGRDFLRDFTLIYDGWSNSFRLINVQV